MTESKRVPLVFEVMIEILKSNFGKITHLFVHDHRYSPPSSVVKFVVPSYISSMLMVNSYMVCAPILATGEVESMACTLFKCPLL